MTILITGAAGFIGFHLAQRLLSCGVRIIGVDNLSSYYDVQLKKDRLERLQRFPNFCFHHIDIADHVAVEKLFQETPFDRVIHMAAQTGVRYSLTNPHAYIQANLVGFTNILEGCRSGNIAHLVYASSSSIYGLNTAMPFSVRHNVDHPVSLYAATKKANELMAHCYSVLYKIPTTGLRFFTVYGPWGRPDMALFKFTRAILNGEVIEVYNEGHMKRDFTYIDDIVESVLRISGHIPVPLPTWDARQPDPGTSSAPYRVYNIGNHQPVGLLDFIHVLEHVLDRKAKVNFQPMQPGDVPETYADVSDLAQEIDFTPSTSIEKGIRHFVDWYRSYFPESPCAEKNAT